MTGKQIKELIDLKNSRIHLAIAADTFQLNEEVVRLIREIDQLRRRCPHEYGEDGLCVYCGSYKDGKE